MHQTQEVVYQLLSQHHPSPSGIHLSAQPARQGSTSIPSCHPILATAVLPQRLSRSVSTHRIAPLCCYRYRTLLEDMPTISNEYRLTFSTSSCSFAVSEMMLQFSINSLWKDCRLSLTFKSPRVKHSAPTGFPRCVVGATCGLHVWIANGGDYS